MAERRMFSKTIIDSDAFLDMPLSAQALYFHLSMRADDDGFINNPKKIQRMIGSSDDDMKLLVAKNFIIPFDSGIVVIKHWRIHNYIRNDRYKSTVYQDERAMLEVKDNKAYTIGIPNGYQMDTQDRLGEDRLGKDSIEREEKPTAPTRHKCGEYKNVLLSDDDMAKLKKEFPDDYQDRIERLSSYIATSGKTYKNYLAVIRKWAREDMAKKDKPTMKRLDNYHDTNEANYDAMMDELMRDFEEDEAR